MDSILKNEILPTLLFFVMFSIAFSFLELLLIFILNGLGRKYWTFVVDFVIRSHVHHGAWIRRGLIVLLGFALAAVIVYTPLVDILVGSSREMRLFALALALVMALIYSISIRKTARTQIERTIYRVIFFLVSLVLYIGILAIAQTSYTRYFQFVDTQLINPAAQTVGQSLEDQQKQTLLEQFRAMNQKGLCKPIDYSQSKEVGLKNFVLVTTDPGLAFGSAFPDTSDPKAFLKGRQCTDGKNTFLLTEWGSWYWVID
jgi:hypothetical protein